LHDRNTRIQAGVFVCLAVAKMRFVAMNAGQQAKRFIHAAVAWNKAVGAEPHLQQAGYLYRYRLLYGHAQAKRLFQKS